MAEFYLRIHPVERGTRTGSATRAAAYRAGENIIDERTGDLYKYAWRTDVQHKRIVLPTPFARDPLYEWALNRSTLWNTAELTERGKKARVAREYLVVLPDEIDPAQRVKLTQRFAQELSDRYKTAVDFAVHHRRLGRAITHHAHLLMTTRELTPQGLGRKSDAEAWIRRAANVWWRWIRRDEIIDVRSRWAAFTNEALMAAGRPERVTHQGKGRPVGMPETGQLSWKEFQHEMLKQGVDLKALRREDRERSRLTPEERAGVRERKRQICLREAAEQVQRRLRKSQLRRQRRLQRSPERIKADLETARLRDQLWWREHGEKHNAARRAAHAARSPEQIEVDRLKNKHRYSQNAEANRRYARDRYQLNKDVRKQQMGEDHRRTNLAAKEGPPSTTTEASLAVPARQPQDLTLQEVQRRAVEAWRDYRRKEVELERVPGGERDHDVGPFSSSSSKDLER